MSQDWGQTAIIQRAGDEVAIRYFNVTRKHYPIGRKKSKTMAHEVSRDFFGSGGWITYEFRKFKTTNHIRWCEGSLMYYLSEPIIYHKNISEALAGTDWQYSALHQYATRHIGAKVNIFKFFHEYKKHPFIEYFIKLRLYRLVDDMLSRAGNFTHHVKMDGQTLTEILGVGKEYLPLLQEIDANDIDLSLIQVAAKAGYKLTADEFRAFIEKKENREQNRRKAGKKQIFPTSEFVQGHIIHGAGL